MMEEVSTRNRKSSSPQNEWKGPREKMTSHMWKSTTQYLKRLKASHVR